MKHIPSRTAILIFLLAAACKPSPRGVIVACVGDSLTDSSYPRHLSKSLAQEGIRTKIFNFGRSGFSSEEYLDYLEGNLAALASEKPDYVLVQLGTNDVRVDHDRVSAERFSSNMRSILDKLSRLKNPEGKKSLILLGTVPPIPDGSPFPFSPESQKRVESEINPILFLIGQQRKIPVVDNYELFLDNPHLLPAVHPSEEGYRSLARNWCEALVLLIK